MSKRVSVIVPIYNVEAYLSRCIDSIIGQTYPELEIILVDDGSPDKYGTICDGYAEKDSRIRVIHKKNGGLSDARNAGLDIAVGDYIYFVDSDDWIGQDAIAVLMEQMTDTVDIVAGSSVDVREENGELCQTRYSVPLGTIRHLNRQEAMKDNLLGGWAAWNKLYRRRLFDTIRFPVGRINEDEAIMLHVLAQCGHVVQVGHPTYFYYLRQNSITTASFSERKMDWLYNCKDNYEFVYHNYPNLLPEAEYRLGCAVLYLLQFMLLEPKRFSHQISQLHMCLSKHYQTLCRNIYATRRDKILTKMFRVILDWKLVELYRMAYGLYRKLKQER